MLKLQLFFSYDYKLNLQTLTLYLFSRHFYPMPSSEITLLALGFEPLTFHTAPGPIGHACSGSHADSLDFHASPRLPRFLLITDLLITRLWPGLLDVCTKYTQRRSVPGTYYQPLGACFSQPVSLYTLFLWILEWVSLMLQTASLPGL